MHPHVLRPSIFLILLMLAACEGDGPTDGVHSRVASAVEPGTAAFAAPLAAEPCSILTAAIVAEVVGVPAARLAQREVAGTCSYDWDGGTAALLRLEVFESDAAAAAHFAETYRETTAGEYAEAGTVMRDELDRRREAGELTEKETEVAEGLAGTVAVAASQTRYEPVAGIGDQAVYDGTIRTMNNALLGRMTTAESKLHFRLANLVTGVTVDGFKVSNDPEALRAGPPREVRQRNREATTALASAVVKELR